MERERWPSLVQRKNDMPYGFMVPIAAFILLGIAISPHVEARDVSFLAAPGTPAREFPRPKRPVADIVSSTRSTEEKRDVADEFAVVARILGLKPGMTVGDIGAGSGYYTVRLSPLVGASGWVIAQDVKRSYLGQLAARLDRLKLGNVRLALGQPHDPRLPAQTLDAVVLAHVYHEVAQPYAFLYNLAPALKPGAQLAIIDLDKAVAEHGTPPALLRCELAAVGYREVSFHVLPGDSGYLAVFEGPDANARPPPSSIKPCKVP
jgi:ubiquinone/menaquinone biosynthesis C-methylase UbiE